jgi:hypothetical protein
MSRIFVAGSDDEIRQEVAPSWGLSMMPLTSSARNRAEQSRSFYMRVLVHGNYDRALSSSHIAFKVKYLLPCSEDRFPVAADRVILSQRFAQGAFRTDARKQFSPRVVGGGIRCIRRLHNSCSGVAGIVVCRSGAAAKQHETTQQPNATPAQPGAIPTRNKSWRLPVNS